MQGLRVLALAAAGAGGALLGAGASIASAPAIVAAGPTPTSQCVIDTKMVQTANDAYFNDNGIYPNGTGPSNAGGSATTRPGQAVDISALVPTYLQTAPPRDESFTYTDTLGTVQGFLGGNKQPCAPKTINRSKSVACETDTKTVQTASDAYVNGHAVYPNGSGPSNTGGTAATQDGQPVDIAALVPLYIHLLPSNEYFAYVNTSGAVAGYVNGHKKPC